MVDRMNVAVFTKDLTDEQKKKMIDYAKCNWDFSGEYSEEEKLLEGADERIVERHENSLDVINRGKFDCVLVYDFDSLSENSKKELEDLGIKLIIFRRQMKIEEERGRYIEKEEIEVEVTDEGDYKKLEPL